MKLLLGLLVSLAISSAFALPARSPKDEVDVIDVPEARGPFRSRGSNADDDDSDADTDFRDFKGVVDTGAGYPFLAPHPFSLSMGFFDSFEDIFRRLRTRLWSTASGEDSDEGGFSLGVDPPKGANTTSVVKVVDGHKIEINDTVYGNGDGSNNAVFKFRVIKIRPLDSDEEVSESETVATQAASTTKPRDIEGNSDENDDSDDGIKTNENENEINHNVDDPEITTIEAITTEMYDTVPHRIQPSDDNAIESDNPIEQDDQLQVDIVADATATTTTELLDDDVASLMKDNINPEGPDAGAYKSEKLSAFVDAENVNDGSEDLEQEIPTESTNIEQDFTSEELNWNESVDVNLKDNNDDNDDVQQPHQEKQEMEDLVDTLGEQLSMIDHEADNDQETEEELSQKLQDHSTSLREDLSSSDDEDDKESVTDDKYEGLNAEWGNLDDKNILTNEIDVYESVPIDLSNDIAVNDIMADQGAPINPDAEIFNVDEVEPSAGESITGRRLEVLSDIK